MEKVLLSSVYWLDGYESGLNHRIHECSGATMKFCDRLLFVLKYSPRFFPGLGCVFGSRKGLYTPMNTESALVAPRFTNG